MKKENRSRVFAGISIIMVLCVTMLIIIAFPSCGKNNGNELSVSEIAPPPPPPPPAGTGSDTIWLNVDEMPVFPGGDVALLKYIAENTIYPETAKKAGIQGKVIVRFCVTSKGSVASCQILKSVSSDIDAEALRVVETIPTFTPAREDGKPVAVWYMVPITFALK
jgi:protein TonB